MDRRSLVAPADPRDDQTDWLTGQELNPRASLRLLCLPYAGGAASIYYRWRELAPEQVQVCAVELPGRGLRMAEAPFLRLAPLVRAMATGLDACFDRPFAIFGHSMGGLIAFELARALRAADRPQPVHLFVSAIEAPGTPSLRPLLGCAPDAELKKELRALNGTPQTLLDNNELMALMLPIVRADFSILETYEFREEPPLPVPITVFGGVSDQVVPPLVLNGWHRQSTRGARLQLFPGGHFFLHTAESDVVRAVARALEPAPALRDPEEER